MEIALPTPAHSLSAPQSHTAACVPLLLLPPELVFRIVHNVFDHDDCSSRDLLTLARTSRQIALFASAVLYHTIRLDSAESIAYFHRAIVAGSKPTRYIASENGRNTSSRFALGALVRRLIVAWQPRDVRIPSVAQRRATQENEETAKLVTEIVALCTDLRMVVVHPQAMRLPLPNRQHPGPRELILSTCTPIIAVGTSMEPSQFSSLTHLCFAQPEPDNFHSPLAVLSSFAHHSIRADALHGAFADPNSAARLLVDVLPNLTHLALPRRTHANEENDFLFTCEIRALLSTRKSLRKVVVIVYPSPYAFSISSPSSIDATPSSNDPPFDGDALLWEKLRDLQHGGSGFGDRIRSDVDGEEEERMDPRVSVVPGYYGTWATPQGWVSSFEPDLDPYDSDDDSEHYSRSSTPSLSSTSSTSLKGSASRPSWVNFWDSVERCALTFK